MIAIATLLLGLAWLGQAEVPTSAEFAGAHNAQCPDHAARVRAVSCKAIEEEPTEFSCRYKLPKIGGGWKQHTAIVARDGERLIWLDGETRCYVSAISSFK